MGRSVLKRVKRLVVKVGTSLVTDRNNHVDPEKIRRIVSQIAELKKDGREVVLVTSGAVGIGLGLMGSTVYPRKLAERQALAAMGQSSLMHMYETFFRERGLSIGQVLLTAQDLQTKERYLNVRNTFLQLLQFGAVPIVNENDTVSVEEVQFGDNDSLSALVALITEAELLIIMTDTDGLYSGDPKKDASARRISVVTRMDKGIREAAQGSDKETAIGGMKTKIDAAGMLMSSGVPMVIASGADPRALSLIIAGNDVGTFFSPSSNRLSHKERWFAHTRKKRGAIVVDDGCREAIVNKGKSILPVGVRSVRGTFEKGDSIRILDLKGGEIGVGLANYGSDELVKILGQKNREEIVHRDKLVLYES